MQLFNRLFSGVFLVTFIISFSNSQDYRKFWHDGKLEWTDFQPTLAGENASELRYTMGFNPERKVLGDTIVRRLVAYVFINRMVSSVNPQYRNSQHLRYNQVVFDILESYRRKLQNELDRARTPAEVNDALQMIHQAAESEILRFRNESRGGHNLQATEMWESVVALQIENSNFDAPAITKTNFSLGTILGAGKSFLAGSLGNHFSVPLSMVFGFEFFWKKTSFMINGGMGTSCFKETYTGKTLWTKGEKATLTTFSFSLGHELFSSPKWRITPFAGLELHEISELGDKDNPADKRMTSWRYNAGVYADYRFWKFLFLQPNSFYGRREFSEMGIRTRFYVSQADFYPDLKGFASHFSIGFYMILSGVKVR